MKKEQEEEDAKKKDSEESDDSEEEVEAPEGMQFVASKDGKKYYAVDSAAGKKIKADKRVYFATEAEAEEAGYAA
jgi:hypothetical protein